MLLNAFPLQIVADGSAVIVGSAVGHETTAKILSGILRVDVPVAPSGSRGPDY